MVASTLYFKDKLVPRKLYRPAVQSLGTSAVRPTFETLSPRVGFLHRPDPSKEFCQKFPQLAAQYKLVKENTCANHLGARSPVTHDLFIPAWESLLSDYHDTKLLSHLTYGFPLGFITIDRPVSNTDNHASTKGNSQAVSHYLDTELKHKALAGPFDSPPFTPWFHVSPMMVRDKKQSDQKRVIVDLSWPLGRSVNSNIPHDVYENTYTAMKLPTAEDLAAAILAAPPTAHMYCLDLSRAYRQLRIDPHDWPLLGLAWQGQYFFDLSLAFGGRWHAAACQRVTEALRFHMAKLAAPIWPYLDDIVGLSPTPQLAHKHFGQLRDVMAKLGLAEAHHKAIPPTRQLTWIGILFDLDQMTMTIPPDKLASARASVQFWLTQSTITVKQLQQLTGTLAHISKCCPAGRLFTSRLYNMLSTPQQTNAVWFTNGAKLELAWFALLLTDYRGIRLIRQPTHSVVTADSCLTDSQFYTLEYPPHITDRALPINQLEMLNLLIATRLWIKQWHSKNILLFLSCEQQHVKFGY